MTIQLLATIANALNPEDADHGGHDVSHTVLAQLETPARYGLTVYMVDGRRFQIDVTELV